MEGAMMQEHVKTYHLEEGRYVRDKAGYYHGINRRLRAERFDLVWHVCVYVCM